MTVEVAGRPDYAEATSRHCRLLRRSRRTFTGSTPLCAPAAANPPFGTAGTAGPLGLVVATRLVCTVISRPCVPVCSRRPAHPGQARASMVLTNVKPSSRPLARARCDGISQEPNLDYSPVAAKTRQRPQNGPAAPRSGGQRLARATSGPIGSYEGPCRCRRGLKSRCAGVKSRCAGASEQVAVRDRDEQSGAGPAQVANERPARRSNALASCFAQGQAASRRKKVRRPVRTRRPAVCRAQ